MKQLENNQSIATMNAAQNKPGCSVLHAALDAMLDCLTVEQQMKVASYLLRETRPVSDSVVSGCLNRTPATTTA